VEEFDVGGCRRIRWRRLRGRSGSLGFVGLFGRLVVLVGWLGCDFGVRCFGWLV